MQYISNIVELKPIHMNKEVCPIIEQIYRCNNVVSGITQGNLKWGMVKTNNEPHPYTLIVIN